MRPNGMRPDGMRIKGTRLIGMRPNGMTPSKLHLQKVRTGISPSHLEGSSTSVGRPGHCQSPVLAVENVDFRQRILFDVPPDGVHVS